MAFVNLTTHFGPPEGSGTAGHMRFFGWVLGIKHICIKIVKRFVPLLHPVGIDTESKPQ